MSQGHSYSMANQAVQHIFQLNKMPDEWRRSILVPIYKNKGDIQSCTNYREIKLMSHTMKLWERVIEHRLRAITRVSMNQFGFMPGRSTTEAIFLIRQVMKRYREKKKDLYWFLLTWRRLMIKYQGMLCGGLWTNIKSQRSMSGSLRTYTTML